MKTLRQLAISVAVYVQSPDDEEDIGLASSGIADAIQMLNSRDWSWMLSTSGFALTPGTLTYPVPDDFRTNRTVVLLNTAGEVAKGISYYDPKTFDTRFQHGTSSSAANGAPEAYTINDPFPSGVIRFNRTPDAGVVSTYPSGQITYYARIAEPVSSGDMIVVSPEVESLIRWYACSFLASIRNPKKVAYAEGRWQVLYRQLKRDESQVRDWRQAIQS